MNENSNKDEADNYDHGNNDDGDIDDNDDDDNDEKEDVDDGEWEGESSGLFSKPSAPSPLMAKRANLRGESFRSLD
jgi:hypothetical protein